MDFVFMEGSISYTLCLVSRQEWVKLMEVRLKNLIEISAFTLYNAV